jgi:hypothetical protein
MRFSAPWVRKKGVELHLARCKNYKGTLPTSLRLEINGKNSYSHRKVKLERSPLILDGR